MTNGTKRGQYAKIAKLRKMGSKGASTRVLHTVERQLRRAKAPSKISEKMAGR